jgi:glutamine amidotransferase
MDFVHSYAARPAGPGETLATHGEPFVAAVESGAVTATQFHPEKSGDAGLQALRNWVVSLH